MRTSLSLVRMKNPPRAGAEKNPPWIVSFCVWSEHKRLEDEKVCLKVTYLLFLAARQLFGP